MGKCCRSGTRTEIRQCSQVRKKGGQHVKLGWGWREGVGVGVGGVMVWECGRVAGANGGGGVSWWMTSPLQETFPQPVHKEGRQKVKKKKGWERIEMEHTMKTRWQSMETWPAKEKEASEEASFLFFFVFFFGSSQIFRDVRSSTIGLRKNPVLRWAAGASFCSFARHHFVPFLLSLRELCRHVGPGWKSPRWAPRCSRERPRAAVAKMAFLELQSHRMLFVNPIAGFRWGMPLWQSPSQPVIPAGLLWLYLTSLFKARAKCAAFPSRFVSNEKRLLNHSSKIFSWGFSFFPAWLRSMGAPLIFVNCGLCEALGDFLSFMPVNRLQIIWQSLILYFYDYHQVIMDPYYHTLRYRLQPNINICYLVHPLNRLRAERCNYIVCIYYCTPSVSEKKIEDWKSRNLDLHSKLQVIHLESNARFPTSLLLPTVMHYWKSFSGILL